MASKKELEAIAKGMGIAGTSKMNITKLEFAIEDKLEDLNEQVDDQLGPQAPEVTVTSEQAANVEPKGKTFCGVNPITGKEIWK